MSMEEKLEEISRKLREKDIDIGHLIKDIILWTKLLIHTAEPCAEPKRIFELWALIWHIHDMIDRELSKEKRRKLSLEEFNEIIDTLVRYENESLAKVIDILKEKCGCKFRS